MCNLHQRRNIIESFPSIKSFTWFLQLRIHQRYQFFNYLIKISLQRQEGEAEVFHPSDYLRSPYCRRWRGWREMKRHFDWTSRNVTRIRHASFIRGRPLSLGPIDIHGKSDTMPVWYAIDIPYLMGLFSRNRLLILARVEDKYFSIIKRKIENTFLFIEKLNLLNYIYKSHINFEVNYCGNRINILNNCDDEQPYSKSTMISFFLIYISKILIRHFQFSLIFISGVESLWWKEKEKENIGNTFVKSSRRNLHEIQPLNGNSICILRFGPFPDH